MSTITSTQLNAPRFVLDTWLNVTEADVCSPTTVPQFTDRTVTVEGDFGVGGEVAIHGSNDMSAGASTFVPLHNLRGATIVLYTDTKAVNIEENTIHIKPVVTGVGVDVNIRLVSYGER